MHGDDSYMHNALSQTLENLKNTTPTILIPFPSCMHIKELATVCMEPGP